MTSRWSDRLRVVALAVVGVIVLAGAGVCAKWLLAGGSTPMPRKLQTVMRVSLPPLPPPPPKPPPPMTPPKEDIKQKIEQPKAPDPTPKQVAKPAPPKPAPPGNPLTAEAGNGPSNYGLRAGDGGGDTIDGKGGSGADAKLVHAAYAQEVADQIQSALRRDDRTRAGRFAISVDVWLTPDGRVSRTRIVQSSGDPAEDEAVLNVISSQSYARQPEGMPHRITFRSTARPA